MVPLPAEHPLDYPQKAITRPKASGEGTIVRAQGAWSYSAPWTRWFFRAPCRRGPWVGAEWTVWARPRRVSDGQRPPSTARPTRSKKIRQRLGSRCSGDLRCDARRIRPREARHCRRRAGPRRQRRSHRPRWAEARSPTAPKGGFSFASPNHISTVEGNRQESGRTKGVAPDMNAPSVRPDQRPDDDCRRRVQRHRRRHQPADQGQGDACAMIWSCRAQAILDPAVTVHTPEMAVSFDRHPRPSIIASKACARGRRHPYVDAQAAKGLFDADAGAAARGGENPGDLDARMGLPDRHLAVDGDRCPRGVADGSQPTAIGLCARRPCMTCPTDTPPA